MGGPRVQEGDEGDGGHHHADAQRVAEPNACHGVEGVAGRVRPCGLVPSFRGVLNVVDLHPVHEEESFVEAIMAPSVWLFAVEAKALVTAFRHLVLREAADGALGVTLLIDG